MTFGSVVSNVVDARYRIATIVSALIILAVTGAAIWNLPEPWAIEICKNVLLGAIGVILVATNSPSTTK